MKDYVSAAGEVNQEAVDELIAGLQAQFGYGLQMARQALAPTSSLGPAWTMLPCKATSKSFHTKSGDPRPHLPPGDRTASGS